MILVTGAAGFIGSHVVERLLREGRRVLGVDNFDPFYPRALKTANLAQAARHAQFSLVEADIRDAAALAAAITAADEPIEAIIHLAARAGVRPSLADPAGYHDVNTVGTVRLLELAARHRISHFVFGSSSSVYGVNPRVPWHEDDLDCQPISPYASSKLGAEFAGRVFAHAHGIRFLALRFFTVYGPRQRPDLAIAKFARLLAAGEPLPLYGDGSTRRDYTFVHDTVDAICRALAYRDSTYEVINVGNRSTVSLAELMRSLGRALGVEPRTTRLPEQPGDVPQTWADISKAQRLLGWAPQTRLDDGLAAYHDWLRESEALAG